jgi:hypothetical protein
VVAFIASLLVTFALLALLVPAAKRYPIGTPFTWGEAMVAATYAFFLMFWVYGVVPHLWLTWADAELGWRPDALLFEYEWLGGLKLGFMKPEALGGSVPMTINMLHVRDLLAVLLYVAFLGGQIALWALWQQRGTKKAAAADASTSDYGRPLVKKA